MLLLQKKKAFEFINPNNEPIFIKIGISAVDVEGAKKNLKGEIGNQTFEQVKKNAQDFWEKQLEKIVIEDTNEDNKVNFYSAIVSRYDRSKFISRCRWTL